MTAESANLIGTATSVTNEFGEFRLENLPPGEYTLTLTMAGMETATVEVLVSVDGTARPSIQMTPEPVSG